MANYRNGLFNGRVISVISNNTGQVYSSRIISHFLNGTELLVTIPSDPARLVIPGASVANVRVVINGRDFAGFGAGDVQGLPNGAAVLPTLESDFGYNGGSPLSLIGANSLQPNRIGETVADLIAAGGFLENDNSPNEPYDIANEQNMFLSFTDGTINIPSFDRPFLGTGPRASFRAFTGTTMPEVDTDGDGINDSVWIDIGLPMQTDDQGRQFRPLVAYRVIDMDGRLNVNAHGSYADQQIREGGGAIMRRGSSYGVAEISLFNVVGDAPTYTNLLNARSDVAEFLVAPNTPRPGNPNNDLGVSQNLFGHPSSLLNTGNLFSTGSDIFGRGVIGRGNVFGTDSWPEFVSGPVLTDAATVSAYSANFSVASGVGDDFFRASEMEALLRSFDVDNNLIDSRLRELGIADERDSLTTHSFNVAMPPVSVLELLRQATNNSTEYDQIVTGTSDATTVAFGSYLSNEVLMGGLFDLNQPTGNGIDENTNRIFDEPTELSLNDQTSDRQDGLNFDLDNQGDNRTGDEFAGQRKATQLYTLAMLVTGDQPPSFTTLTTQQYRRSVAQWAVNVVDFSDPDSICTAFEYDTNPLNNSLVDGDPTTANEADRGIVFGLERPELVINEVIVTHDRRNQDLAGDSGEGETTMDGDMDGEPDDDDWDSSHIPATSAYIELYNPNTQTSSTINPITGAVENNPTGFQRNGAEFSSDQVGVDLSMRAPDNTPCLLYTSDAADE